MASVKKLVRALTDEVEGGYRITLEMEGGEIVRVFATEGQLGDLTDEFDELLSDDDTELSDDQKNAGEQQPS